MSRRAGNWQASEGSFRRQHPSCSIPKGTSCYKKGLGPGRPLRSRWRSLEFFGGCHLAEVLGACGMWWGGGVVFSHTIPTKEKKHGPLEHSAPRLSKQLWQPPCRKSWLKSKRTPLSFRRPEGYWNHRNHPKTQ